MIYGGRCDQWCGGLGVRSSGTRPVEQIAEALSRDVATVTGKCRRPVTIDWWTSALAGRVFRIPHTHPAAHRPEPRAGVLVRIPACSRRS